MYVALFCISCSSISGFIHRTCCTACATTLPCTGIFVYTYINVLHYHFLLL